MRWWLPCSLHFGLMRHQLFFSIVQRPEDSPGSSSLAMSRHWSHFPPCFIWLSDLAITWSLGLRTVLSALILCTWSHSVTALVLCTSTEYTNDNPVLENALLQNHKKSSQILGLRWMSFDLYIRSAATGSDLLGSACRFTVSRCGHILRADELAPRKIMMIICAWQDKFHSKLIGHMSLAIYALLCIPSCSSIL